MRKRSRFCSSPCRMLSQDPSGPDNPSWTGNAATYGARHACVYRTRGKADHCSLRPGLSNCTSTNYEWAQIPGTDGLDVREYVSLCAPCHHALDHIGFQAGVPRPWLQQGSKNGRGKLNDNIVLECRKRFAAGESTGALAREYKVCYNVMRRAILGITWSHVNLP